MFEAQNVVMKCAEVSVTNPLRRHIDKSTACTCLIDKAQGIFAILKLDKPFYIDFIFTFRD